MREVGSKWSQPPFFIQKIIIFAYIKNELKL